MQARRFLDRFAAAQAWVEELLGLVNGWVLIVALGLVMVALYLAQLLGNLQGGVAVAWTLAMIVGADLYWLVTITRAHGHWLHWRTHWAPAIFWTALGAYLGFVNYQSVVAYQLVWLEGMTWQGAFEHMGITLDQFIDERGVVLIALIVITGVARHARTSGLTATPAAGDAGTPGLLPPPPGRGSRPAPGASTARPRRGASEEVRIRVLQEQAARAYFASHPTARARGLAAHLRTQGLACSNGTAQVLYERFNPPSIELVAG